MSGIRFGTQVSPAPQRQGFWVKPPHGPSSFEIQTFGVFGTHLQTVVSKCVPRMQRTFCTHCFGADVTASVLTPELDDPSDSSEPPQAAKRTTEKTQTPIAFIFIPSSSSKGVVRDAPDPSASVATPAACARVD
jgi:hypothetical protein